MKASVRIIAAAALALGASSSFAADNLSLAVTAGVAAVCQLTLSGPMAFGALDPTSALDKTASVTASYKCTKGTAVTSFTVGGAAAGPHTGSMVGTVATPDSIGYSIAWTAPAAYTGAGLGSAITARTVTLAGTVPNANFVNAKPDSYSDAVAIAVNY